MENETEPIAVEQTTDNTNAEKSIGNAMSPKGFMAKIKNFKNRPKNPLTKMEKKWALYDAGNSAVYMFFILIGVSIGELAKGTPFAENSTRTMSIFNAATGLIIAILGPIMGAVADNKGRKKPMFAFFVFMGVGGCFLSLLTNFSALATGVAFDLGFFIPFSICLCMILIGLGGSLLFYDSMLCDITTEQRADKVSSGGFAYGYILSLIPFSICLAIYYFFMDPQFSYENYPFIHTLNEGYAALRLAITTCLAITGAWWITLTIPLLKNFKQTTGVEPVKHQVRDAFRKLRKTIGELRKYKYAFLFMLAFFCYINGVNTVIALTATYAKEVFTAADSVVKIEGSLLNVYLIVALMGTQVVSCIFSVIFGKLAPKFGARNLILVSVIGYLAFTIYGVFMKTLVDFFILAVGVGVFQGGIQALSRSYFSKLAPLEKQTEFFGIYDIFNKSSNFLGSILFAAICTAFQSSGMAAVGANRRAVACLTVFFFVGAIILFFIPKNHADEVQSID